MNDIHAVVFDIGNVLVGWQPEAFFSTAGSGPVGAKSCLPRLI